MGNEQKGKLFNMLRLSVYLLTEALIKPSNCLHYHSLVWANIQVSLDYLPYHNVIVRQEPDLCTGMSV